jgi:competence protein ComEA
VISKLAGGLLGAAVLAAVGFSARTHSESPEPEPGALRSSLFAPSSPATLSSAMSFPVEAGVVAVPTPSAEPVLSKTTAAVSEGPSSSSSPAILPDGRIVLNLASEEDLRRLPGIGPTRARAILELRQRLAKFRAVEDLLRVRGIGRKMIQRMRPAVVVDRPPAPLVQPGKAP